MLNLLITLNRIERKKYKRIKQETEPQVPRTANFKTWPKYALNNNAFYKNINSYNFVVVSYIYFQ